MPTWLTEVLKLLGFTTPFVYAAATYGVFLWLDKKASGRAKTSMTSWLQGGVRVDPLSIVVELFDKLYSHPLLSRRAFVRSALITIGVCLIIWMEQRMFVRWASFPPPYNIASWASVGVALIFNVLGDFVSLFAVRYWLVRAKDRPIISLLAGPLVGAVIILVFYYVRLLVMVPLYDLVVHGRVSAPETWLFLSNNFVRLTAEDRSLYPALVVHFWLPLLAIAVLTAQSMMWVARGGGWMQWFLKQGQHHPFQAVGYVAALIVLVVGVVIQMLTR